MWISPILCFVGSVLVGLSLEVTIAEPETVKRPYKLSAQSFPVDRVSVSANVDDHHALSTEPKTMKTTTSRVAKRSFSPWGGKRKFNPWGGKRNGAMEPIGNTDDSGKDFTGDYERRASFQQWGGKRANIEGNGEEESMEKRREFTWNAAGVPSARSIGYVGRNKFNYGDIVNNRRGFNPWGGKRFWMTKMKKFQRTNIDPQTI